MKSKLFTAVAVALGILGFSTQKANAQIAKVSVDKVTMENVMKDNEGKLSTQVDDQKRSWLSHIIVRDKDEMGKRLGVPDAPVNMPKWLKNPKVTDPVKGNTYLWNKGHGVGNQFGGEASNDGKNIAAETVYLNQVLMLHYEGSTKTPNSLDNWLYLHPNYALDYYVVFNYQNAGDQIPTSVTLAYRGLDQKGQPIEIKLPNDTHEGSGKQEVTNNSFTKVTLQNIEPGYVLDYQTGAYAKADGKKEAVHDGWAMADYNLDKLLAGKAKMATSGVIKKTKELVPPGTTDKVKAKGKEASNGLIKSLGGKQTLIVMGVAFLLILSYFVD